MKTLKLLGATIGLACFVVVIVALIALVGYVNYQHHQQIDRLSTAAELPNGDAPVPVGYPVSEVV